MIQSLPHLFARAHGVDCIGPESCVYCGAPASDRYELKETFTARDTLARPRSQYACAGCLLCLEEIGEAAYPDGTRKTWTKAYRRMHSWAVTENAAVPHTFVHQAFLRAFLLAPPAPPWGVCLTSSGQRHLLYLTPVCRDEGHGAVSLDGEPIRYTVPALASRLALVSRIVAAAGRPATEDEPNANLWSAVVTAYPDGDELVSMWDRVRAEPLTRLAIFVCPKKEDCPDVVRSLDAAAALPG